MSLYKFTSSRLCKTIAGFLFGVMLLSACQETAQVVNKSAAMEASEAIAKSGVDNSQALQSPTAPLTDEERALLNEIAVDKDFIALRQMQNTLLFKMKIAIGHDKERFKQATINNDEKTLIAMMNFSDSEYRKFFSEFKAKTDKFHARFAANKQILEGLQKRGSSCQTCQTDMNSLNADVVDKGIEQIASFDLSMENSISSTEQECMLNNREQYNLMKAEQNACTVVAFACNTVAMFTCPPCILLCMAAWAGCMAASACARCQIGC